MQIHVLAFGAHPDDVELFASGTLAKIAAQGFRTGIVDLSRGELGTRGSKTIRAREAGVAARVLGLSHRANLGLPDGNISVDTRSRLRVIRVLRRFRPILVLAPYWEDAHPDHVQASQLVREASHHAGLAKIQTRQPRHRPRSVIYYKLPSQVRPSFIVDVSAYLQQRRDAIGAYRSQLHDPRRSEPARNTYLSRGNFLAQLESLHAYYGTLIGKEAGEGFHYPGVMEMDNPLAYFSERTPGPFF